MKTYLVTELQDLLSKLFKVYFNTTQRYHHCSWCSYVCEVGNLGIIEEELKDSRIKFEKVDIRDREGIERIFTENNVDYVVNFAAESHVDRSIENPQIFLETNILGKHKTF